MSGEQIRFPRLKPWAKKLEIYAEAVGEKLEIYAEAVGGLDNDVMFQFSAHGFNRGHDVK